MVVVHATLGYRPEVDGLRGLAVSLVVLFHFFPQTLSGGFVGVDVFFVISGYLITSLILLESQTQSFSFLNFYIRRIRRILPSLVTVMVFSLVAGWVALTVNEYASLGKHVAAGAVFASNFVLFSEHGYFDAAAELKPMLHLWSLGIEEQFYLVWPLLLVLLARRGGLGCALLLVLVAGSYFLNIHDVKVDPVKNFYMPQTRFWELGMGAALAFANRVVTDKDINMLRSLARLFKQSFVLEAAAVSGLLMILYASIAFAATDAFPGRRALVPTLGAMLLIASGANSLIGRCLLASYLPRWLGKISFPLYLWHWPLLSFAVIMSGDHVSPQARFAIIGIALILSWLTFNAIEFPARYRGSASRNAIRLIFGLVAVGLMGFEIQRQGGELAGKTMDSVSSLYRAYPHGPDHDEACDGRFPQFRSYHRCRLSKADSDPEVVIIGDSHGAHFYNAMSARFAPRTTMNLGYQLCLPFAGEPRPGCEQVQAQTYRFLADTPSIRVVYLSGFWHHLLVGGFKKDVIGGGILNDWNPAKAAKFEAEGERLISMLLAAGKQVVFLRDVPDLDFFPTECLSFRPIRFLEYVRAPCAIRRQGFEVRESIMNERLDGLLSRFPRVTVVDPRHFLCDEEFCWAARDGKLLYHDRHHLSEFGAEMLVGHMQ